MGLLDVKGSRIVERQRGRRFYIPDFSKKQKETGVRLYLHDKGFRTPTHQNKIIRTYAEDKGLIENTLSPICIKIQEDFYSFVTWLQSQIQKQ